MAIKTIYGTYACGHCGKQFPSPSEADAHRDSHELIYVPFTKTDLNRLLNFITSKNEEYLTKSLMDTLQKYISGN